jgi:hypothetical protein
MDFLAARDAMEKAKTMKRALSVFAVVLSGLAFATRLAGAGEIRIIANRSVGAASVSAEEVKSVFLETRTVLKGGSRVQPIIVKSSVYSQFVELYLGKTVEGLETYYRSLIFSGTGSIPKTFSTDVEVVAYVSRTRGAMAYVSALAQTAGVKTLEVK